MPTVIEGTTRASGLRLAIVVSRFNDIVTNRLLECALETIREAGGDVEGTTVVRVPGAFELPLAAKKLSLLKRCDAVVCLGTVIRGETHHFDYICAETARGIGEVMLETGVPVSFGVITAENAAQAMARSEPNGLNRGREAVLAAIEMANVVKQFSNLR